MRSVTKNGRSIFLTAVLAIILVYLFSIVGFLFFKDDFLMEVDHHPSLSKSEVSWSACSYGHPLKNVLFWSYIFYYRDVLKCGGHYHVTARSWTHQRDYLCKCFSEINERLPVLQLIFWA